MTPSLIHGAEVISTGLGDTSVELASKMSFAHYTCVTLKSCVQ